MKCMSCGVDIPPTFKGAIQNNLCPSCNGPIMSDPAIELLDELKEAFKKMPNDPEGLAGWLLSNYEMRKIGTGEPVQFHNPGYYPQHPQFNRTNDLYGKEQELRQNPQVAENKLQTFYKNAGLKSKDHYSAIAKQIQGGEAGPDYGEMPVRPINPILAQQLGQLQGYPQGGYPPQGPPGYPQGYPGYPPQGQGYPPPGYPPSYQGYPPGYQGGEYQEELDPEYAQKALSAMSGTERPMNRAQLEAMKAQMSGEGISFGGDEPNASPAIQALRMEQLRKQQELSYGGSVGKIKRS